MVEDITGVKWWVAGSRSIRDLHIISMLLEENIVPGDVVRTGGARGVDRRAERWAKRNGIRVEPALKPEWSRYGRGAGFIRNTVGVKWADRAIVIWDGHSKGSEHVIQECKRLRKPVRVHVI